MVDRNRLAAAIAWAETPIRWRYGLGFNWPDPQPYQFVRGDFTSSADIGTYVFTIFSTGSGSTLSDAGLPATSGLGFWYLTAPDCVAHDWTSGGPTELAGRDAALP